MQITHKESDNLSQLLQIIQAQHGEGEADAMQTPVYSSGNGTQFFPLQWLFFSPWLPFDCRPIEAVLWCHFYSTFQMAGHVQIQNWTITQNFCQVGWCVNTPIHCVFRPVGVNIKHAAKFEEVSCYFSAVAVRIFLVLLANVCLHSHDFRCNFRSEYAKPGRWFLCFAGLTSLIRAWNRQQDWQTSPSTVIMVDLTSLALVGTSWLHISTSHLFPWSLKSLHKKDPAAVAQTRVFYISLNGLSNC